ncbi:MAG TPA: amino acid ABC transporter substrate-binding protein [Usitatibacter sp.]|jgi:ABC-type amino acid transport substrate-binding protein|nr:amino acid ABC transporter substrate-binding protein [Usitatibacter sp.]
MKKALVLLVLSCAALSLPVLGADTLARIKAAKAINVAYSPDSLPFAFTDKTGPEGYTIDICKRVIAQVGRAVGEPNLKVNWMPGQTTERLAMVASGKADLECGNTTQTLARLAKVDFSSLIFLEMGGFVSRADSKIEHLGDMGGRKIVVLKGTTTEARLNTALQRKLINAEIVPVGDAADGMVKLASGEADAYAGDRIKLLGLLTQAKEPARYKFLDEEISYEPYALALPRGDSAFRLEVNRALSQLYASGEIIRIYVAWLGSLGQPPDLIKAMYIISAIPD